MWRTTRDHTDRGSAEVSGLLCCSGGGVLSLLHNGSLFGAVMTQEGEDVIIVDSSE